MVTRGRWHRPRATHGRQGKPEVTARRSFRRGIHYERGSCLRGDEKVTARGDGDVGTFQVDDVRRLKTLEAENARLKTLVAEHDLEIEVMKEIAAKKW